MYTFQLSHHDDICLKLEVKGQESNHRINIRLIYEDYLYVNMGHDYHLGFPALLWLTQAQVHGTNLFEDINADKPEVYLEAKDEKEITEVIETALPIASAISLGLRLNQPLTNTEFNEKDRHGIANFYNGIFNYIHYFTLDENGNLVLTRRKKDDKEGSEIEVLTIPSGNYCILAGTFLEFVRSEERLGRYKHQVFGLVERLRGHKFSTKR